MGNDRLTGNLKYNCKGKIYQIEGTYGKGKSNKSGT